MVNDEYQLDIYKIDTKAKIDKRKIIIVILIVLAIITIVLTGNYIAKTIKAYKAYKQYEAQINAIKYAEEEKKAKIAEELERKRQEKIPKLTDTRKAEYEYNLSLRYKKSFFNI